MAPDRLNQTADRFRVLAEELESARLHALTAASHFRNADVARGCAHSFALEGHVQIVVNEMKELAIYHARHSTPDTR